jgi:hypothetical protein
MLSFIFSLFSPPGDIVAKCNDYYRRAPGGALGGRESEEASGWVCPNDRPIYRGENIKGPFHTNDSALVEAFSGTTAPVFGNDNMGDRIEVYDRGQDQGSTCTGNVRNANCACPFRTSRSVLDTGIDGGRSCSKTAKLGTGALLVTGPDAGYIDMPEGNADLKIWAGLPAPSGHLYSGRTTITLRSDGKYDVTSPGYSQNGIPYPDDGVIYVQNSDANASCDSIPNSEYTSATNPGGMAVGCSLTELKGTYNQSLTIGSQSDIVITGDVQRAAGTSALLGLVANHYVRIRHYKSATGDNKNYMRRCVFTASWNIFDLFGLAPFADCMNMSFLDIGDVAAQLLSGKPAYVCEAEGGSATGSVRRIDAAILALQRSFTLDSSECGEQIGDTTDKLVVNGAVTQSWRGAITSQEWSAAFDSLCANAGGGWLGGFVGTIVNGLGWCSNHHGYRTKDVNYDYLFRALSPPHFLTPKESAWRINRIRQTAPACSCGPTGATG